MEKHIHNTHLLINKLRSEDFSNMVQEAMLEEEFLAEIAYFQKEKLNARPEAIDQLMHWVRSGNEAAQPQL